ncbi:N-acyl-D-amino-acid deacylase family protein [Bowmanella dokdonensis]|uniref:D-aminoacylase n=1 Tax=Bowmanella dokdonensis TaxID=751969 RepID=A0A939ISP0_9ALTE|nr:D-aminoacylase [Bowmanella dokdonensis]MBN7826937.1 D-aminoacylase [Bowmanella dokdonensis]
MSEQATTDLVITNATLYDGSGQPATCQDLAIQGDKIQAIGQLKHLRPTQTLDAAGLALAPGFIDVHTHDDIEVIRHPQMLNKLSQGVTTVIVGNCGISASPVAVQQQLPDPLNLLGKAGEFRFPSLRDYIQAVEQARPAVNVAALVGHTALRAQFMDRLDRAATAEEIQQMAALLQAALAEGAKGLSTGLAYHSAVHAPAEEVEALAALLPDFQALYTTHLRTEFDGILGALDEAFAVGKRHNVRVVISHLKCAGKANWGRSKEVLAHVEKARKHQHIGCDCYPYHASSSTLDLAQVTDDFDIMITWSETCPEMAGMTLAQIAATWQTSLREAAIRLQPAGAVYHGMDESDVQTILSFPHSMVGSDGLPCDPSPHPRLWGTFPRVLGHYVRDRRLMPLNLAIHKMTGLSAHEFALSGRGLLKPGYQADLVLFDPKQVGDKATFIDPKQLSEGIHRVWVNGQLSYLNDQQQAQLTANRAGRFLRHQRRPA